VRAHRWTSNCLVQPHARPQCCESACHIHPWPLAPAGGGAGLSGGGDAPLPARLEVVADVLALLAAVPPPGPAHTWVCVGPGRWLLDLMNGTYIWLTEAGSAAESAAGASAAGGEAAAAEGEAAGTGDESAMTGDEGAVAGDESAVSTGAGGGARLSELGEEAAAMLASVQLPAINPGEPARWTRRGLIGRACLAQACTWTRPPGSQAHRSCLAQACTWTRPPGPRPTGPVWPPPPCQWQAHQPRPAPPRPPSEATPPPHPPPPPLPSPPPRCTAQGSPAAARRQLSPPLRAPRRHPAAAAALRGRAAAGRARGGPAGQGRAGGAGQPAGGAHRQHGRR